MYYFILQPSPAYLQTSSGHLGGLLGSISRRDLLVLSESSSLRRGSDSSVDSGSHPHDSGVNGAGNTVVQLVVQLWQSVLLVHRSLGQVSDGSSLHHVSDGDSLDGLILWNTSSAVQTSDGLDVTSTLLVSTVGSSLLWHVAVTVSTTFESVVAPGGSWTRMVSEQELFTFALESV